MKRCPNDSDKEYAAVQPVPMNESRHIPCRSHLGSVSRSEEHTSELQSRLHLVCRLLLEKKKHTEPDTALLTKGRLIRLPPPRERSHRLEPRLLLGAATRTTQLGAGALAVCGRLVLHRGR